MRQRKLFPAENQNVSCTDLCDSSTCQYGCDSYTSLYPMPPNPPSPIQEFPPPTTKQNHQISPVGIVMISLLASFFLFVAYYVAVVKRCGGCTRFRPRSRRPSVDIHNDQFLDGNRGPINVIDHPIWYINTIGLQASIIDSITIFRYKKGDSLIEGTDCAVCLNEFQNGDTLRLLPKCNHAFHIPCIDTWLRSHTNCPVCRSCIVSDPLASNNGLNSRTTMARDSGSREEISEANEESNNAMNQLRNDAFCSSGVGAEGAAELPPIRVDNQATDGDCELNPLRRSVSADYLSAANETCADCGIIQSEHEEYHEHSRQDSSNRPAENSVLVGRIVGSSIAEFLHKKPIKMKRSFSCSGRSILSRQYSTSRNKLKLPL